MGLLKVPALNSPSDPEVGLDPDGEADVDHVVEAGLRGVRVGAVHYHGHLEPRHVLQEPQVWLQKHAQERLGITVKGREQCDDQRGRHT